MFGDAAAALTPRSVPSFEDELRRLLDAMGPVVVAAPAVDVELGEGSRWKGEDHLSAALVSSDPGDGVLPPAPRWPTARTWPWSTPSPAPWSPSPTPPASGTPPPPAATGPGTGDRTTRPGRRSAPLIRPALRVLGWLRSLRGIPAACGCS